MTGIENVLDSICLQNSYRDLMAPRDLKKHKDLYDETDLLIIDGFRIAGMIWLLMFFAAQYTMAGILANPWTLMDFFETYIFTIVYAAN